MSQRDGDIRERILDWCARAEEDFEAAEVLLSQRSPVIRPGCFHSQQCAEKYLKALLIRHQIEFPWTHEIEKLLGLVASVDAPLARSLADADKLTPYGVVIRYRSSFPHVSLELAREAFEIASKVRDAVRETLRDFLGETPNDGHGNEGGET